MNIRAQVGTVFHLDKCIGCHTCSIACKNIWTDRKGTEYMWWNNVETKPGTGFPTDWEDQNEYRGGWEKKGKKLKLKQRGRVGTLLNLFYNPDLPKMEDYYHPWTYDYQNLFNSPIRPYQPTARPISMITGKPVDIVGGPNWDDDLSGSPIYAENDINLEGLTDQEREEMFQLERLVFFYLPRICNHCLNPSCVAACPAGAIYKRGDDGIVLVSQDACRAWRMCISGCPYKKVYYNWSTGRAEKCILCYPRLETGQPQACFHSCVGRIRYTGMLLYDADEIEQIALSPEPDLVEAIRSIIKDPYDPEVIQAAKENGVAEDLIQGAQKSPVFQFVKKWKIALPLHAEFRTLPMLFYVPSLSPVLAKMRDENFEIHNDGKDGLAPMLTSLDDSRVPLKYLANLFSAGNEEIIREVYLKLIAVRIHMRSKRVKDYKEETVQQALKMANMTFREAEDIFQLTSLATYEDRFVIPPLGREKAIEVISDPFVESAEAGFGYQNRPKRKW